MCGEESRGRTRHEAIGLVADAAFALHYHFGFGIRCSSITVRMMPDLSCQPFLHVLG